MKTLMLSTALVLAVSVAFAADFDANEVVVSAQSGGLEFSLGTVDGELNSVATTATFANYQLGRFDTSVDATVSYGRLDETLGVELEYNLSTDLNAQVELYGTAAVAYTAPTSDLGNGEVSVAPTLGAAYSINETLSAFGDVTYSWNVSNEWAREGGAVEVGVDYQVAQNVDITPSLVRTFDTGADTTNMKLELGLRF